MLSGSVSSRNRKCRLGTSNRGETIFKEGEMAKELLHHQKRQVEIQLGNRLLATLVTNGIFGEMALIDSAPGSDANRQD